ncbi:YcaO-like family protein [Virgibacillus salarius]
MFHKLGLQKTVDFPIDLFLNETPKLSIVTQASVVINNLVGPETGSSVNYNKMKSLRKAVAEAVERRCSMLGGKVSNNMDGYVETWDLIKNDKSFIEQKYTRLLNGMVDTTASAIHPNSSIAISNALKELFEKNSLFLFWYGLVGHKIKYVHYKNNNYFNFFEKSGFNVSVFINTYFNPLITIIVIAYKENDQFICGLGTNTILETAIKHAFEEAFLIGYMRYYALMLGFSFEENIWTDRDNISHIQKLDKLDYVNFTSNNDCELTVKNILSNKPKFITELHVIYIEQFLLPSWKCARVYSKDLLNCLPLKDNIDLSSSINQNTVLIDDVTLKDTPECPMS